MRSRIYPTLFASIVLMLGALVGCEAKLTPEQRSILGVAALASKERAVSFEAVSSAGLIMPIPGEITAEQIARYVQIHKRQLNSQAVALNDLVIAVNDTGRLSQGARTKLAEEAETAQSRYENYASLSSKFTGPPEVLDYLQVHGAALKQQATALANLAASFPPKEVKSDEVARLSGSGDKK